MHQRDREHENNHHDHIFCCSRDGHEEDGVDNDDVQNGW